MTASARRSLVANFVAVIVVLLGILVTAEPSAAVGRIAAAATTFEPSYDPSAHANPRTNQAVVGASESTYTRQSEGGRSPGSSLGAERGVAAEDESLAGVDRGDGRDAYGRFTGSGGYGAGAQAQGLDDYTTATGRGVISNQVRATLPDGTTRYYDGLSLGPDGTYQGVEVKSGSAGLTASQRAFDSQVDGGVPATAMVEGVPMSITSTYLVRVP